MNLFPAFVTLTLAKQHLQMDHDSDDALIQSQIEMASAIILDYLKIPAVPAAWSSETGGTGSDAGSGVPLLVQQATLLAVAEMYKNREASNADILASGVTTILWRMRDPAMA